MSRQRNSLPGHTGTTIVAGALVLAFALTVLFTFSPSLNPFDLLAGRILEVSVPDVRGETQQKALVALVGERLTGEVEFAYDADVALGTVIRQNPLPVTSVKRNSVVTITVSRGPAFIPLPDLAGQNRGAAVTQLKSLGLDVVERELADEGVPAEEVISLLPAPGTVVQSGTSVTLTVSTGPVGRSVPNIAGLPLEGAAFFLGRAGLALGAVTYQDDANAVKGSVISTNPPITTELARDTPIDLVVSSGKPAAAVPNVVGKSQTEAARILSGAGFVIGEVSEIGAVADPLDGSVRGQVPSAGTLLRPGEVVTVTVRRATPAPPTTSPTTVPPTTVAPPVVPPATPTPDGTGGG